MKLILVHVVIFGVLTSFFNVSAQNFDCYVCESDLYETQPESCELAHERHIETCNYLISTKDKACKTEWKRDKNEVLVWVKRSCGNVVDKALTIEANCGEDGHHKDGKCFCTKNKCNDMSFMDPAWKDKNYRYPLSPVAIVFIVLSCLAFVTLIGLLIWWCVKIRRDKKNRAVAPENPDTDVETESEVKIESDNVEPEPPKLEPDPKLESDPEVEFESADPDPDPVTVENEIVDPQPQPEP